MAKKPLQTLYESLRASNYDVPDNYGSFERTLTAPGKEGVRNRQTLYKALRDNNYDVPDTYESFSRTLFSPVKPTGGTAASGQSMLPADVEERRMRTRKPQQTHPLNKSRARQRLQAQQQAIENQQKRWEQQNQEFKEDIARREQRLPGGMDRFEERAKEHLATGEAAPVPLAPNDEVVRGDIVFNPDTGRMEQTYTTPEGGMYFDRNTAEFEHQLDNLPADEIELLEREQELIGMGILRRGRELEQEYESQSWWDKFMAGLATDPEMGPGPRERMAEDDEELQSLLAAWRKNRDALRIMYDKRNNDMNSFWHNFGTTVANGYTFTGGEAELHDAQAILNSSKRMDEIQRKIEAGEKLSNVENAALSLAQNTAWDNAIQAMYGDDYGAWATAGGAAVQSLEMMPEFIAGMPVLKGMGTAAIKLLTRNAAKGFGRFMLKGLGMTLGTMAGGAIMANTIQAERTLGKAAGKAAGSWWFGDDGEFMLGHYDGDQFVSGGESLATALFHAEQEAIPEAASEGAGEFLPGIGQVLSKIGLSRIAKPLASLSGKGWYKTYQNMLRAAGWHGVGGEALEEYVGTLDGLIMGDVEGVKRLADPRTHFDIWLSCATLGPLLNAPVVLGSSMRGVYSPVAYHKLKAAVTRQDKIASFRLTEDRWAPWRDRIDATPNEQMADLMVEIRDDQDLAPQEKKAIFDYVKALQGYRGWNLGEYIFGKDAEEDGEGKTEQEQQQSQEYSNGYETVTPEERRAAKDRLDVARARLENKGYSEQWMQWVDSTPIDDVMSDLTERGLAGDTEAVTEYLNAKAAYDGMLARVNDDIDDEVAVANEAIEQRVAPENAGGDGMIHPAVLKDGREVFIISGNVATLADNSIDVENSDSMIIVRDAEGNEDTISPDKIQSLGEVQDPAQQRQEVEQQIVDEQGQAAAAQIEGQLPFNVGDQYTINYQGEPHTYQVVQADENNVAVLVDGAQEPVVLTKQQLQQMADEEHAEQIQAQAAAADTVEEEPAAVEPEQPVEAPAVEETPAAPVVPEDNPTAAMPMDDQGEPAWDQVEPERGHQFLYQESGWPQAMADNFVQDRIDEAEKALTKAQEAGQKLVYNPKPTFSAQQQAVAENTAAQQAAQSALDYWKGVQGIQAAATAPVVETPAEQEPTEQAAPEPAAPVEPEASEPEASEPVEETPVEETPAPVAENDMQPVEVEQPAEEVEPEKTDIELLQEEFEDELSRDDIKVEVLPETFEESSAEMTVNVTVDGQPTNIWFVVGEGNTVDEHWKRISEPFPEMSWQEVDDLAEEYNQAMGKIVCDANDEAKRINFYDIEEAIAFEKWMQEREQPGPLQELERLFDDVYLAASLYDRNVEIIPESVEVTEDGDIQGRLRIDGEDTDIWVAKSNKGIFEDAEGARVFVKVDPSRDVNIENLAADYNKEFHKYNPDDPAPCKVAEEGDRIDFDDLEDAYQFYIEQPEHTQRVEALKAEAEARAKARNTEDIKYSVESQGEVPTGEKQKKFDIAEANNSGDPNEYVIYQGVYHDPSGYAVSTNGHILVADKRAYDEKHKGKLIASKRVKKAREVKNNPAVTEPVEKGQPIPIERYPNWKSVKAGKEGTETAKVDFKKFADWVAGVEARMKEQWQQWKDEHPDEKMSFNSWRDHSRIQIMTPDGRVRWFKFNDMQVFARAAADQGSKTLRFYPNNSDLALQAESKNGFVLMMPLHIGSDYERLVDSPYRIEGGLNIDKNGSVFTYDMTMPGKTATGRVELNYESGKDAESRAYIEEVMEREDWDEEAKSEFRKILDDAADLVSRMAQGFTRLREWNNKKLTDEQGNYNPLWRVWDKAVGWIPNRSSFKKNGEYPYNIDLGALCTKREAFDAVVRYIKEQGWGQNLGPNQIEALKSLLREHGFLTACDICFNETKRARALDYGNAVAYYWNAVRQAVGIDDDLPVGTPRELTDEQMKILTALAASKNGKAFSKYIPKEVRRTYETYINSKGQRKRREADKGLTPTMTAKIAKLFLQDPSLMGRFEGTTLLSTDSVDALVRQYPHTTIAEFIAGAWGSATPKPNEGFNIYDPLSWKQAYDKKRQRPAMDWFFNLGGFRAQSFSDYSPIFFYDYVQMFTDLAIRRLPIHIYTKVPALIKLFGGTGAKFNMSLVPEVVQGVDAEHLGLKPDGKGGWELAWHEDSFPVDEAFALRQDPRFNGNVGTIAVGISDAHIRMLLDDPRIDMVIPYHKSGMPKSVQIKTGLNNATDYTDDQKTKGKKKGLKDFSFNEALRRLGDPRKAADEYLAWCKQNKCTPKFPQFADHPNYYKVLEDFRCIDNEGNYSPQQPVQVSFFDDVEQRLSESLEDRTMQEGLDNAIRGNDAITEGIKKIMSKPRLDGKIRDMMLARLKQVLGKDNVASLKQEDFFEELQKVYTDQMGAERAQQQVEVLRTSGGIVYGFAVGDRIVLNENYFNAETPMHEFTHVWVKVARLANPQMWAEGKELLKQTKEWQEVMSDEFYRDIQGDEDAVASEVLSRIVGQDAARQINEMFAPEDKPQERPGIYNKIKQWVNKFLDGVRSLFSDNAKGLTYDELVRMPMKALFDDAEAARFMEALQQVNEEDVDLSSQGSVPTFYSNAERAVQNVKQNKATAEQWKAMLAKQGGIKAGEDKWIGLSTWLDEHKGETLTKDEVLQFVRDNAVQMEEVNYEDKTSEIKKGLDDFANEFDSIVAQKKEEGSENDIYDEAFADMVEKYGDDFDMAFMVSKTNFPESSAILVPVREFGGELSDAAKYFLGVDNQEDNLINKTRLDYTTPGLENKREIAFVVPNVEPYQETDEIHFGPENEGRAIMWVRFGETRDADGNRVLVIDEIQSNRHQDAREKGYRSKDASNEYEAAFRALEDATKEIQSKYFIDPANQSPRNIRTFLPSNIAEDYLNKRSRFNELNYLNEDIRNKVPAAPFEKNWHEVAMKRMLRLAAEEGFDKVAWTTGAQQTERYGLGGIIDSIYIAKSKRDNSKYAITVFDKNADVINSVSKDYTPQELADTFGKDMAQRLIDGEAEQSSGNERHLQYHIEGVDLEVGGEGMKSFYDGMLPQYMNKYGKRWGVKVGEVTLDTPGKEVMHSVDVTPEMRRSVMTEGQPLFQIKKGGETDVRANSAQYNDGTQGDQTRSANFKNWFGDWENDPEHASKVVDEEGRPLVVYHGTDADFTIFDISKSGSNTGNTGFYGRGFYFSDKESTASAYGKGLIPVYLDIKNPFYADRVEELYADIIPLTDFGYPEGYTLADYQREIAEIAENRIEQYVTVDGEKYYVGVRDKENERIFNYLLKQIDEDEVQDYLSGKKVAEGLKQAAAERILEDRYPGIKQTGQFLLMDFPATTLEKVFKENGFDGVIGDGTNFWDVGAKEYVVFDPTQVKSADEVTFDDEGNEIPEEERYNPDEQDIRYRELDEDEDAELIDRLENGPHITTYSTKIKVDDGYVPPMSSKDNETGEMRAPEHEQKWNESEERPDLAKQDKKTGKWKFDLKKSNDKDVNGVLYNPYNHSGSGMLNDQFSEAQDRDDLVVVEQVVPQSEETDKYKAEKANDPTGWKAWKAGPITAKMTGKRKVFLSRWHKITRVVPWNEVADAVAKDLGNQFDVLPTNPFPPQLRAELEKKGYKFVKTDNKCVIQEGEYKGATWSERYYDVYPDRAKSKDKREKGARAKAVKEQNTKELFDYAKKRFGVTTDFREAGYILPDGTMLDFSGRHELNEGDDSSFLKGHRTVDHRYVSNELSYQEDGWTPTGIKTSMTDFIERGAIRINGPSSINLAVKPTKEQAATLRRYLAGKQFALIDFGNGDTTEHYAAYGDDIDPNAPAIRSSRVLADIDRYFDDGIKPEGTARYRDILEDGGTLKVYQSEGKWRVEGVPGEFNTQFGAVDNARNFLQGHVFEVAEDGNSIEVLGAGSNLDNMLGADTAAEQRPTQQATAKQRKAEERARKWRERTVANGRRRVEELGQRLGVKVTIVDDMSEQEREGLGKKKRRAKGWYDVRTGEVFINLGNHRTVSDIEATFLHEVVAHKGLRRLFGEEFNTFLHNVYYNVDASIREEINRLMVKNNWDYREATEEYLAKLAQQMNFERPEKYVKAWETVARLFRTLLQKVGLGNGMNLKDSDLQGILFESYHNMEKEGVAGLAESVEFRDWMEREANNRGIAAVYGTEQPDVAAEASEPSGDQTKEDREYMDAVESGDIAKASRMVMEAAKRAMPNTKVVDESGRPLVVYHTNREGTGFYVFDTSVKRNRINMGSHFGTAVQAANIALDGESDGYKPKTYAVYLDLKNPLYVVDFFADDNAYWANLLVKLVNENNIDDPEINDVIAGAKEKWPWLDGNEESLWTNDNYDQRNDSKYQYDDLPEIYQALRNVLERLGYDGFVYENQIEGDGLSYVAFHPEQIKSAEVVTLDDGGNVIPLSERFNPEKEDIRFRDDEDELEDFEDSEDFYEEELEEEAENAEDLGEEVDDSEAGPSSFQEMMLGKMLQAANSAGAAQSARVSAMRSLGGALQQIRKAMSTQRNYDRETVNTIVRLAREVMASGYFNDLTRGEVKRLLAAAKNANGSANVTEQANKVVDTMLRHHLRECENLLKKQLKVKGSKTNASGVEVQAGLDIEGQRMTTAMKQGMRLDEQGLSDRVADCLSRMGSSDPVVSSVAAQEYTGLMLAQQYHDTIKASRQEEKQMREEMRQAKAEFAARRDSLSPEELKRQRQDLKDYIAATEDAIRQNRMERADAYNQLSEMLGGGIASSMERAKQWREQQRERVGEIQHNANSDLQDVPADEHMRPTWKHRMANWAVVRFFMKPLATFDYMLRMMGQKSPNGEGYLWNRFMGGWVEANDKEWRNIKAAHQVLDEKVKEVFNADRPGLPKFKVKRWSDLFFIERKMKGMEVDFWDGDQIKRHTLTPGNLLYIYMVNKMSDGKMKLRKMGMSDADVEAIKNHLDPRLIELADWLQEEFLVQKRTEYNAVHERLFGAPMAAIENYFPLKINSRSRSQEEDVNNQDANPDDNRGSTITGAIIKRVRNNKALDVTGADAFDVILEHIQNMEHWAAFAEFNRDLNTLLSYKRFRNRILNMSSARFGSGQKLWTNFKRVCAIASGVYRPKVDYDSVDTNLVNVAKGVTRAKISFRFYTALKQLLSYPAYLSTANPIELIKSSNPVGAVKAWNWAIDNLPGFAERWQSRQAGDTRLKESDADWGLWKSKIIDTASRWGMSPNAFIDGLTVAMGAKAIYETKFKQLKKLGYSDEQAKQRAKRDASVAYNETQQSSANAYTSAMQLDRTAASVALTVFRNASMGYQRRLFQSFANLKHMATKGYKAQSLEYLAKQMERDGLDKPTAEAAAKKVYNRTLFQNIADVAIFGWVMQAAWNLGAYLPYLFMGDDDDDKKEMLTDAALHAIAGGIEGLTGGSVISDTYNSIRSGEANMYSNELLPLLSDMESLKRTFKKDVIEGANDLVNLIIQAGVGVNPQTITDWVVAGLDVAKGDPRLANEFGLLVMRVMSAPQGQLDKLYIDELGLTAGEAKQLNAEEFAQRYARYKMGRESTFTGWAYSEQGHNDAVDRYVKNFGKKVKERLVGKDIATLDDAYERGDDYMKDIVGKAIKTRLEAADDSELPTIYKYTTNEVTKKTAGREMAKRISKNEDLDEYFDKQRDPVLRKAAASEIAKRLGTQDYAGKTPQAKWTQETKDAHERYQELRTAADVQEDCQVTLLKVSDEDKAELREIKKYLGQGGDDAAIMQEYREARAEILKNYK